MTNINKIFELFKNLKSDAVPRPPRPSKADPQPQVEEENDENIDSTNEPEEIFVESDEETKKSEKKPKFKKTFFKPSKKDSGKGEKHGTSSINTQATGNVINIVNSKNLRWGNDYYMGPTNMKPARPSHEEEEPEEYIEKCNIIQLLLEAKIRPEHEYIDYISKNLGKNWQSFFRTLGFTKGAIETMEIDTKSYGVSEARYKLLLNWAQNDEDGTLGRLANYLWEEGERQIVKELALLYKRSNNKK